MKKFTLPLATLSISLLIGCGGSSKKNTVNNNPSSNETDLFKIEKASFILKGTSKNPKAKPT